MNAKFYIYFFICFTLLFSQVIAEYDFLQINKSQNHINNIWDADLYLITNPDPYYTLLASTMASYYTIKTNTSTLKPILLNPSEDLENYHQRFIESYQKQPNIAVLGSDINLSYETQLYHQFPSNLSLEIASLAPSNSKAIITPYGQGINYTLSLYATLLSSYLNIPLIIFQDNHQEINKKISHLNIDELYIIGDINPDLFDTKNTHVYPTTTSITKKIAETLKQYFQRINYIVLTNPSDIQEKQRISTHIIDKLYSLNNVQCILAGKKITLTGTDTLCTQISIPKGIHHLQCAMTYTSNTQQTFFLSNKEPIISSTLYDPFNNIVGYSNSHALDMGKLFVDTLIIETPGNYTLVFSVYQGIRGGFFSLRGISNVHGNLSITIQDDHLETSHFPYIQSLSSLAPYLTSARKGIIIANETFSLTSSPYEKIAKGYASGPWYEENLHSFNNKKVNQTISTIQTNLNILDDHDLLTSYLNGPAWFALLGDTNMIPMYYYSPSQQGIPEKGLPSDNPYSLNYSLSVGRIMGYTSSDVSNLICRTLFYEPLCTNQFDETWAHSFHFMYGEGFGETGGLFHQIPYAKEIESYGFQTEVYGDFRNNRQYAENNHVFTGANYNEYLGHGDWFWYVPSLYGFDCLQKAFDVAHLKTWVFNKPSIFLTSACLMGRVDGIPPQMNIGMTLLHAGCNAFIGSTRETGQEAGLEIIENALIQNDSSIGEALREEKRLDHINPTFLVRTLYGDPAFNPYEPCNGFTSFYIEKINDI